MRAEDLVHRLHDEPFKPFRVHLSDRTVLDVIEPGMVIIGESTAVLPIEFGREADGYRLARRWRTIALAHITQFSDLDARVNGKNRRRR
jgi:hypothetical protein